MFLYEEIRHVHLEISSRCNAACPLCPRNLWGINGIIDDFPICDLTLLQVKKIFEVDFLKQLETLLINGNYGDFVTCKEAVEIIEYLRNSNDKLQIVIQTNGSGQPHIWSRLAELDAHVYFSIDGSKDTNHLYRQNTNFDLIIKNAKTFIDAGGHAEWHFIKFDFNETQIEEIQQMSQSLKFKKFFLRDAGRNDYHVFNKDRTYNFSVGNPKMPADFQRLVEIFEWTKTSDKTQIYQTAKSKNVNCLAKRGKSIYVAANGEVFPCCWTGFSPRTDNRKPGNNQLRSILENYNNNALEVGLKQAMEWFQDLEKTWDLPDVLQGKNYICNDTCGT